MTVVRHRNDRSYAYRFWHLKRLHQKAGYATRRAAGEEEWKERRKVGATGKRGRAALADVTLAGAVARYLEEVITTHASGRDVTRTFARVTERLGARPLASITHQDVSAYQRWRASQPRSPRRPAKLDAASSSSYPSEPPPPVKGSSVNRELAHLSAFFTWAMQQGLVTANPAVSALVPRAAEPWPARIALTRQQRQQLLTFAPNAREAAKAELLYLLGVRKQVVLDLAWERINFRHRLVQYRSKGKDRTIPLAPRAVTLLRQLGPKPSGRVFAETSDTTLRRWWAKARTALGLPTLRRHDLRVTFARDVHGGGGDLATVRDLLGHSTVEMTQRYLPASLSAARRAVQRLR